MLGDSSSRLLAAVGVGAVTVAGATYWAYRRKQELEWVEVGTIDSLMLFPIKSGGGYTVGDCQITKFGMFDGNIIDRSFVVMMPTSDEWKHVTSAMAPPLTTVQSSMKHGIFTMRAPTASPLIVDTNETVKGDKRTFKFKNYDSVGYDCGDEASEWLQKVLYPDKSSPPAIRLMFVGNPEELQRPAVVPQIFSFPQYLKDDMQIFHDNCAFHLFTRESFDDFNSRLSRTIPLAQMRPNIVVKAKKAYEEDHWAYVRIGEDVQLRTLKPRETCMRININPERGERQEEVARVLSSYRVSPLQKELADAWSKNPLFGLHLGLDNEGDVEVGDKVWAVVKKPHWFL